MKNLIGFILTLGSLFTMAEDVAIARKNHDYMILTDTKCEDFGNVFRAHTSKEGDVSGCYFITENGYVVMRRNDTELIYAYPIVIFEKLLHV